MKTSTVILGVSAWRPDSAAVLLRDGRVLAAAKEAWLAIDGNDTGFPKAAVTFCLDQAGLPLDAVDYVAFHEKPLQTFLRIIESFYAFAPRGLPAFMKAVPEWLGERLFAKKKIAEALEDLHRGPVRARPFFTSHHQSHAAAAFYPSPFEDAAILVVDGKGEYATTSIGKGVGRDIDLLREIKYPHSLGLLHGAFVRHAGFADRHGRQAFDRLAQDGEPRYLDPILNTLIDAKADGSFRLNMPYFAYATGPNPTTAAFDRLFGHPIRQPGEALRQEDRDMAASLWQVAGDLMVKMAAAAHDLTDCRQLVMAGDMANNTAIHARLLAESPFDDLWIPPACGDAGGALGAALAGWHVLLDHMREFGTGRPSPNGFYVGPDFDIAEIERRLATKGANGRRFESDEVLLEEVAAGLDQGQLWGWFGGSMLFGDRQIGTRCILADPRRKDTLERLNPSSASLINIALDHSDLADRSTLQVEPHTLPRLHRLLELFAEQCDGQLIGTIPLQTEDGRVAVFPEDAYDSLLTLDIDGLVAGNWLLEKEEQA